MSRRFMTLIPLFILLLAIVVRIPLLSGSLWMDEAAQALESARPLSQQLDIAYDFQPPLYHLVVHALAQLDRSEWWLRVSSLIPAVVSIWAVMQIGRVRKTPVAGQLAAVFVALNSYHIFYSQELRPYAFASMWGILSWWALLRWIHIASAHSAKKITTHKSDHSHNGFVFHLHIPKLFLIETSQRGSFILYTLCTLAGLYSVYLYPFLLLSQVAFVFLVHRQLLRHYVLSVSAAAIGFLPWVPSVLEQLSVATALRASTTGWDQVVSFPQMKALPLTLGKFVYGVVPLDPSPFVLVSAGLMILCSVVIVVHLLKHSPKNTFEPFLFAVITVGIPLITAWAVSFYAPLIQPKRVLFLLPLVYLSLSEVLLSYACERSSILRRSAVMLLVLLMAIQVFGTVQYWTDPRLQREDWRSAIHSISEDFSPQETVVVFGFGEPFAPWNWYPHPDFPVITTGTASVTSVDEIKQQMATALQYETVVVFDYLRDLTDPHRQIEAWLERYGFSQQELYDYPNIGFIRVFRRHQQFASGS